MNTIEIIITSLGILSANFIALRNGQNERDIAKDRRQRLEVKNIIKEDNKILNEKIELLDKNIKEFESSNKVFNIERTIAITNLEATLNDLKHELKEFENDLTKIDEMRIEVHQNSLVIKKIDDTLNKIIKPVLTNEKEPPHKP